MKGEEKETILIVAAHDSLGGAARAIYRVFSALNSLDDDRFRYRLRVISKWTDDSSVAGGRPRRSLQEQLSYLWKTRVLRLLNRGEFITTNPILHSSAQYPSGLAREINACKPSLVMLGWLGNATLSIEEISKIRAPVIFRLSDMWVFSGAEHYSENRRYTTGYSRGSRPSDESGPDLNRHTYLRKRRAWKKPMGVVAISKWLEAETKSSPVTANWPLTVIPVPLDTSFWQPVAKEAARRQLDLPFNENLVVFGAGAGTSQPHKGADLLFEALPKLLSNLRTTRFGPSTRVVIFGQDHGPEYIEGTPVQYLGRLNDEELRAVYSAADVVVVPSRLEAFGQVAAEAQCCGAPVVAFEGTGVSDIVLDGKTGKLARPFDSHDLAECIAWVVSDPDRKINLSKAAATHARLRFSPSVIARKYSDFFTEILGRS